MRFGSTAKVLLKCKLKYYRISECDGPPVVVLVCSLNFGNGDEERLRLVALGKCCVLPWSSKFIGHIVHWRLRAVVETLIEAGDSPVLKKQLPTF